MERGLLIAIEGADGCGKATQSALLVKRLGGNAVLYSFPRYETELGKTILRHLKSDTLVASKIDSDGEYCFKRAPEDALWFQCVCAADKYVAAPAIEHLLAHGRHVVCDRWKPSAVAFGTADGLDPTWVEQLQDRMPNADLNIYLSISEEETLRRRPTLRDRYEKDRAKQAVVREQYQRIWFEHKTDATEPNMWCVIDGEGSVEQVHTRIWEQVANVEAALR